jgi:tetratricopeptide (TPR) repeat protein
MLSPKEIADEIETNLDFLSSTRRDLPEKHRSLRAAFDYSWKLLSEEQRAGFEKLSVFRGGFERDAAKKVAGADLRVLVSLVDKSLIRRNDQGRYEIHELLRQYAEEKLDKRPEISEKVHNLHAQYYLGFLASRKENFMSEGLIETREEVRTEIDNLRASVDWSVINWESNPVRETLEDLNHFYMVQGWHEGLDAFRYIVRKVKEERQNDHGSDEDPVYLSARALQASYLTHLGLHEQSEEIFQELLPKVQEQGLNREESLILAYQAVNRAVRGDYQESVEIADEAIAFTRKLGGDVLVGILLLWQGWAYYQIGEYEIAHSRFEESLAINKKRKNPWGLSFTLSKLGLIADAMKDYEKALEYHDDARASFISLQDQAGEAYTLSRKSMSYYGLGEYQESVRVGRKGFEMFEELGHRWGIGIALCRIGFPNLALGKNEESRELFQRALERAQEYKMESMALYAIGGLACVLTREGNFTEACHLFTFFLDHPMTAAIYKDLVESFVEETVSELSEGQMKVSEEWAKDQDIESVTSKLLGKGVEAIVVS